MKYMCLAYEDERELNALSASEWDALRVRSRNAVTAFVAVAPALGLQGRPTTRRDSPATSTLG